MKKELNNNYAFIDAQNLYLAINELGWKLRMFMGFLPINQELYNFLQSQARKEPHKDKTL